MSDPSVSRVAFFWDVLMSVVSAQMGRFYPTLKAPFADLTGKTAIVTGSNSGIGLQIALDLARQNAVVYLACRNQLKAQDAVKEIASAVPGSAGRIHTLDLDTSSLSSVRACAKDWASRNSKVDILFHNAGIGDALGQKFTADGLPPIYETNFLGSFLFTYLLEQSLSDDARVILTSSTGHYAASFKQDFSLTSTPNQLEPGFHYPPSNSKVVAGSMEYANSKAMQVAFSTLLTQRWARQAEESGKHSHLISHSFTPGFTTTPIFDKFETASLFSDPMFWFLRVSYTVFAIPVQQGALTGVWLASTKDREVVGERMGGAYWDRMTRRIPRTDFLSQDDLERLWIRWEADAGIEWR